VSEPTKCYAVTSGAYSEYQVHAVYRRREDAEARVRANNEAAEYLLDGEPYRGGLNGLPRVQKRPRHGDTYVIDWNRVSKNPAREWDGEARVEEFDYYEGEPLPAPLEGEG
jgi:hypothetical protein